MFRVLFERSPDAIFVEDLDGTVLDVNPAACALHGMRREELIGLNMLALVPPERRERVMAEHAKLASREWNRLDGVSLHRDGRRIPIELRVSHIDYYGQPALLLHVRDKSDPNIPRGVGDLTALDRTEQALRDSEAHYRQLAETNRRLLREVNHRVRNNLASLLSLVSLVRKSTSTVDSFAAAMHDRIRALAQVHALLSDANWRNLELRGMVQSLVESMGVLAPHHIPVDIEGPSVTISPHQAGPLVLTLCELFNNSIKHGAHTSATGRLSVDWRCAAADNGTLVRLRWTETGGPPISREVKPSLGTELIEGFINFQLGGRCFLRYTPIGADHLFEFTLLDLSLE